MSQNTLFRALQTLQTISSSILFQEIVGKEDSINLGFEMILGESKNISLLAIEICIESLSEQVKIDIVELQQVKHIH